MICFVRLSTALRAKCNSSNKLQCASLLKFGTHCQLDSRHNSIQILTTDTLMRFNVVAAYQTYNS